MPSANGLQQPLPKKPPLVGRLFCFWECPFAKTQQGGFATVIILLVAGLAGLGFVRGGGRSIEA